MVDILKQQTEHATILLDLLNAENAALKTRDAAALTDIATKKARQTQMLDQLTSVQNDMLKHAACTSDAAGLNQYIEHTAAGERPALRQTAADLAQILMCCRKQNSINGNIIAANTHFVNTAINILRNTPHSAETTYDELGREISGNEPNPIAKA